MMCAADLPHELLVDIMGWLRFSDLKTCRLVCHSFSKCASEKVRACVVKSSPVAQKYAGFTVVPLRACNTAYMRTTICGIMAGTHGLVSSEQLSK